MTELPAVKKVISDGRYELRVKMNRVRALELVTAVDAMLADVDADAAARADLYASVSSLWLDLGDQDRSEHWIVKAIEVDAQVTPTRPVIQGTHRLFYAKLLYAQQRYAEAAHNAIEGLAIYAQGVDAGNRELARIRVDLAPILKYRADQA